MSVSRAARLSLLVALLLCAAGARAEERSPANPATLFHAGLGLILLPNAICPSASGPCQPGESALALSLMALVRLRHCGGRCALGAGADVAFGLRPEHGAGAPGRDHTSDYFSFDALFRYYLPSPRWLDWWVGASTGVVVLSDIWSTPTDRYPYSDIQFVGPKRLTLGTPGLSFGPSIGYSVPFGQRWLIGGAIRYTGWIFPANRAQTPLGDSASLAGYINAVEAGVLLGFRVGM